MISYFVALAAVFLAFQLYKWTMERKMIDQISGKFVLVTGCDSGFGRRLTEKLLKLGVNVFAGCFTDDGQESLEKECSKFQGKLWTVKLDITNQKSVDDCQEFVLKILKQQNSKLWALVNNAGFLAVYGPMDWIGVEEYEQSVNVNLIGAIRMTTKFTSLVKESKGRIVTMISASGRIHGFYTAPYVAAKFGLEGYVDNLRLKLKPFDVKVSCLEPGAFRTNLMSPEAMIRRVESVWQKLDEQTKAEYGVDFKDNYVTSHNTGTTLVANRNLDIVVDSYIHALFAENPRIRYVCGWDAKLLFIPMSFMPSSWQDAIIQLMMDITSGAYKPAVLKNKHSKKHHLSKHKPAAAS
uniref:17-beta-hydroxysteroid dehydrogenase type 6 n=1 Tax=Panagrolaimus sp. JU765 TaxID=591449 RepID=A0AC34RKV6_9BILA